MNYASSTLRKASEKIGTHVNITFYPVNIRVSFVLCPYFVPKSIISILILRFITSILCVRMRSALTTPFHFVPDANHAWSICWSLPFSQEGASHTQWLDVEPHQRWSSLFHQRRWCDMGHRPSRRLWWEFRAHMGHLPDPLCA
jgi:hypothetical protein